MTRYRLLPKRSKLWIDARSSLHPIRAETSALEGELELEVNGSSLDLSTPPRGSLEVDVADIKTGNGLYDRQIESELEMRKYPRIRGEVREVQPLNGNRFRVRGELTLHGVTRPLEGDVTVKTVDNNTLEIEGEKTIDLRDFNLEPPRILMLKVHPDVKIRARILAQRQE